MAILKAPTFQDQSYSGTHGNYSKKVAKMTLASAAISDVVLMAKFDAGITITDININADALGASTGYKVGIAYPSGTTDVADAFYTKADSSSASSAVYSGGAVRVEEPCFVTVTVTGAAATGDVELIIGYINHGSL